MMPRWLTNTIYVTLITLPPALSALAPARALDKTLSGSPPSNYPLITVF